VFSGPRTKQITRSRGTREWKRSFKWNLKNVERSERQAVKFSLQVKRSISIEFRPVSGSEKVKSVWGAQVKTWTHWILSLQRSGSASSQAIIAGKAAKNWHAWLVTQIWTKPHSWVKTKAVNTETDYFTSHLTIKPGRDVRSLEKIRIISKNARAGTLKGTRRAVKSSIIIPLREARPAKNPIRPKSKTITNS
jgi:hypothetical protein